MGADEDILEQLSRSGVRFVGAGGRIAMRDFNGDPVTIPASELEQALSVGYTVETPEAYHEQVLREEHGDAPIRAFLGAAGNTATMGLLDLARSTTREGREILRAERQYNPTATGIGEFAGMLAPLGAGSLAGKAGRAAAEAVGGTSIVEGLLGGGVAARAAGQAVKFGARAGVEGAVLSAPGGVSEAALSQDPMTAEALVSAVGSHALHGGLWSSAAGAGLGALGSLAQAAGKRVVGATERWAAAKAAEPVVPADLAALDGAGLKAAREAEVDAIRASQRQTREAIAEEVVGLRESVRSLPVHRDIKLAGAAGKGLGPEWNAVERGMQQVARAPSTIARDPRRALEALEGLDGVASRLRGQIGDRATYLDDVAARAKDLRTRLEATTAAPASERLAMVDARIGTLSQPASLGRQAVEAAKEHALSVGAGAVTGMLGGGPLGSLAAAAAGWGVGVLRKRLVSSSGEFAAQLSAGIDRAVNGAVRAAPALSSRVAAGVSLGASEPDRDGPRSVQAVLDAVADMPATRRRIHESLTGVRAVDLELAGQMEAVAVRRLEYLSSIAPRDPGLGQLGQADKFSPSRGEVAKFHRAAAATEKPLRILDHLASDTLTPGVVEAVRAVYPEMFARLGTELLDKLVEPGRKPLSPARQIGISMITGSPISSRLRPQTIAATQAAYTQMRADAERAARKPRPPAIPRPGRLSALEPTSAQSRYGD